MFDVVSMENSHAIAYTTQQLVYHMDQQFYESPPGLQLLHCLKYYTINITIIIKLIICVGVHAGLMIVWREERVSCWICSQ